MAFFPAWKSPLCGGARRRGRDTLARRSRPPPQSPPRRTVVVPTEYRKTRGGFPRRVRRTGRFSRNVSAPVPTPQPPRWPSRARTRTRWRGGRARIVPPRTQSRRGTRDPARRYPTTRPATVRVPSRARLRRPRRPTVRESRRGACARGGGSIQPRTPGTRANRPRNPGVASPPRRRRGDAPRRAPTSRRGAGVETFRDGTSAGRARRNARESPRTPRFDDGTPPRTDPRRREKYRRRRRRRATVRDRPRRRIHPRNRRRSREDKTRVDRRDANGPASPTNPSPNPSANVAIRRARAIPKTPPERKSPPPPRVSPRGRTRRAPPRE